MNELLLVAGMAAVTLGIRYPVLVLVGKIPLPESVFRALRYVPPAVLTAIIVPAVLMPAGTVDVSPTNAYLVAGIVSALVAWRTKSLLLTIIIGMAVMLIWSAVVG
ncbi:MAG: AzlD domain-containing protein [Anaerolineae bacterium]|nr:AzlD domain-containing protein [Anaerolineae bacterium]